MDQEILGYGGMVYHHPHVTLIVSNEVSNVFNKKKIHSKILGKIILIIQFYILTKKKVTHDNFISLSRFRHDMVEKNRGKRGLGPKIGRNNEGTHENTGDTLHMPIQTKPKAKGFTCT